MEPGSVVDSEGTRRRSAASREVFFYQFGDPE